MPCPPAPNKPHSFTSLAAYLSGGPKPPSPPLDSSPSSKRRKTTPKRYSDPTIPSFYSSSLSGSPNSLEGGEEEGEEERGVQEERGKEVEEDEDSRDELIIAESKPDLAQLEEQGVDLTKRRAVGEGGVTGAGSVNKK